MTCHTRHMVVRGTGLLLLLVCNNFLFSIHIHASNTQNTDTTVGEISQTVTPPISNTVLLNPGKGWVLYGTPENQTPDTMTEATVGYMRYNWSDIEPAEKTYNWSIIDKDLNAWHDRGKQFAFGVMSANSSNPDVSYVTPKWVFADGAATVRSRTFDTILGLAGIQYVPVWDDPIFLKKVSDFVTALAAHYDGNPQLAYIDIRSYGNWGGQSVNGISGSLPVSAQSIQKHIQIYKNAFKRTQLIVPWGTSSNRTIYTSAVKNGIGLRSDSVLVDSNGNELAAAYGKTPAIIELKGGYQWLNQKGYWNDAKLTNAIIAGKASYVGMGLWGNDASDMLSQKTQLVQTLANLIGYHFILTSATVPTTITNNQENSLSMIWKNQGVASLIQPASVAIGLLNGSNQVIQKKWLTGIDPRTWMPGNPVTFTQKITFSGIPAGNYQLAVGLFLHPTDTNPTYKIGNQGRTDTGWYILSSNPPPTPSWTMAGAMSTPRANHAATLLPNGKVLVVGGDGLGSAELYDPRTGAWTTTGTMSPPPSNQIAMVLLHNGKVLALATGGNNGHGNAEGHVELYDPRTGAWTMTGAILTPRLNSTMTLLPNGKVLVAGGSLDFDGSAAGVTGSAELYNPATGTWTMTGAMSIPRYNQTAIRLSNGKVLITAGDGSKGSAELYNPASGTWTTTGAMSMPRAWDTMTLLPSGKVLVAGGYGVRSTELYNPASGTWTIWGMMSIPRIGSTMTLLPDGKVLVAGGYGVKSTELYEPGSVGMAP